VGKTREDKDRATPRPCESDDGSVAAHDDPGKAIDHAGLSKDLGHHLKEGMGRVGRGVKEAGGQAAGKD